LRSCDSDACPPWCAALDRSAFYRLDPEAITLTDNSKGFGNQQSLRIA
jgi:hypothetical protein